MESEHIGYVQTVVEGKHLGTCGGAGTTGRVGVM